MFRRLIELLFQRESGESRVTMMRRLLVDKPQKLRVIWPRHDPAKLRAPECKTRLREVPKKKKVG